MKELEVKILEVGNDLRSKQINDNKNNTRTEASDQAIAELSQKLDDLAEKAARYEEKAVELEAEQQELDQDLEDVKATYQRKEAELEDFKNLINDLWNDEKEDLDMTRFICDWTPKYVVILYLLDPFIRNPCCSTP